MLPALEHRTPSSSVLRLRLALLAPQACGWPIVGPCDHKKKTRLITSERKETALCRGSACHIIKSNFFLIDQRFKQFPEMDYPTLLLALLHVYRDSFEAAVPSNRHIVSEPGKNVTLTCQPQMTWPVQAVRWEKIQPRQIDLLTYCNLVHGRNFTSKFPRQIVSNCSHGRWSVIVIPDVTASDSGLYRCHLKASAGENETFVMRLTVAEGKTDNQYTLFVAGGTVLLLLFVISITTIIVIFLNRRRRRERRDLFTESWDTQKAPNNYRSPISTSQPTNQSMDDTREDIYVNYPTFSRRPKTRV
nr:CD226 antigen isoform X2 [Gorilla gorilla gorilla]